MQKRLAPPPLRSEVVTTSAPLISGWAFRPLFLRSLLVVAAVFRTVAGRDAEQRYYLDVVRIDVLAIGALCLESQIAKCRAYSASGTGLVQSLQTGVLPPPSLRFSPAATSTRPAFPIHFQRGYNEKKVINPPRSRISAK